MATERFEIIVTSRGTRKVQRDIRNIGAAASSTRKTLGFLRAALVVIASAAILRGFVDLADSFTVIRNRLKLVTGSTAELTAVQNKLFLISQETGTALESNVELFARTARSTLRLRLSFTELVDITRGVNQAMILSGVTAQEAAGGLIQFAQGLAAGALQGEELRSVAEAFPELAKIIGKEFGVAAGELIAFNKANVGAIKTERIIKAIQEALPELNRRFAETNQTIERGLVRVNNALRLFIGGVSSASGATEFLSGILTTAANNIDKVVLGLLAIIGLVAFNFIIGQVAVLNARILLLGSAGVGALRTLGLAFGALLSPITLLRVLITGVGKAVLFAFTPFTFLGRIAVTVILALVSPLKTIVILFRALRVAILTNPLFLIGAVVIGTLVGLFFLFQDEIKGVIDRLGGLVGIFDTIAAVGIGTVKAIIQTWRLFPAAILEIAIDAANFFRKTFETAINDVISALNRFTPVEIDPVDFGSFDNDVRGSAAQIEMAFVAAFQAVREAEPTEVIKRKFSELRDFLKGFTAAGLQVDPDVLAGLPPSDITGEPLGDVAQLRKRQSALDSLLASVSPLIAATLELAKATKTLNEAEELGLELPIERSEIMRRLMRNIIGVGNAEVELADKQTLLNDALRLGAITLEEFNNRLRDINIEFLEGQTDALSGFQLGLLEASKSFNDFGVLAKDVVVNAFQGMEDAITDFVTKGKIDIRSLVDSIIADLVRLAVRQAITGPLSTAFAGAFGGGGGLLSSLFGGGGPTPLQQAGSFSHGGSFTVGSGTSAGRLPGIDNRLVAFGARDREEVTVTPPGQAKGQRPISIQINVTTPDANSFQRSRDQIFASAQAAMARAAETDL